MHQQFYWQAQRKEDSELKDMIEQDLADQLDGKKPWQDIPEKLEEDEAEEDEESEDDSKAQGSNVVDAAINALKTAKQEKRGKKIRKKIVKDKT